ncbi:MAG: hypothetical protein AMJ53_01455 [Gammaproteobacteria bacterium SG8_11]|nr:MAG: hypothetical protein AMJ53_01455 [Gammaproteobacteria bacterium SG8_11]
MAKTTRDQWNPDFLATSPLFFPLQHFAAFLSCHRERWPELQDYQNLLRQQALVPESMAGKSIRFVPQAVKPVDWRKDYEPRIYLSGEVQTRLHNWHDFFQVLIWCAFPKTKSILNAKHYRAIKQRKESDLHSKQRTPVENALTQFDECGAIIVSSDSGLLQYVREFRWKELFWHHRAAVNSRLQCFIFGHAVYEKALKPYIGLTAHGVLFPVETDFFHWSLTRRLNYLDNITAQAFENECYPNPKCFQPFPLLGMPHWDNNNVETYYDNSSYFRPGRVTQGASTA